MLKNFYDFYITKTLIVMDAYNHNLNIPENFVSTFTIFILSCFVGYYVVLRVSPALHASLMSITNAISGIIIVGAILASNFNTLEGSTFLGFFAIFLASVNIFGGLVITNRMVRMFEFKNRQ